MMKVTMIYDDLDFNLSGVQAEHRPNDAPVQDMIVSYKVIYRVLISYR